MATPEAGTKRVCPETGKKFYDLNKDPIISPYTGESYPLSFFEVEKAETVKQDASDKSASTDDSQTDDDDEELAGASAEIVTLEEADAEVAGDDNVPGLEDDEDDNIELADDDNTFLETDDEDDDMSDLVVDAGDDEKDA